MTRDEAVADVKVVLGFRSDQDSQIVTELQRAQVKAETMTTLPHFLITEVWSNTTAADEDEERIALPTGFIREFEEDALWYYDATADDTGKKWNPLLKLDTDVMREAYQSSTDGFPKAYSLDGNYFRILPTSDTAHTIKIIYYKKDDLLTSNIENGWLANYPDILIGEAGVRIAGALRDKDAAAEFSRRRDDERALLFRNEEARKHANRRYVMGGAN